MLKGRRGGAKRTSGTWWAHRGVGHGLAARRKVVRFRLGIGSRQRVVSKEWAALLMPGTRHGGVTPPVTSRFPPRSDSIPQARQYNSTTKSCPSSGELALMNT